MKTLVLINFIFLAAFTFAQRGLQLYSQPTQTSRFMTNFPVSTVNPANSMARMNHSTKKPGTFKPQKLNTDIISQV